MTGREKTEARTVQNERTDIKRRVCYYENKCRSLLPHPITVKHVNNSEIQTKQAVTMDLRKIEQFEREEPAEETLNTTNRWKELLKPGRSTKH